MQGKNENSAAMAVPVAPYLSPSDFGGTGRTQIPGVSQWEPDNSAKDQIADGNVASASKTNATCSALRMMEELNTPEITFENMEFNFDNILKEENFETQCGRPNLTTGSLFEPDSQTDIYDDYDDTSYSCNHIGDSNILGTIDTSELLNNSNSCVKKEKALYAEVISKKFFGGDASSPSSILMEEDWFQDIMNLPIEELENSICLEESLMNLTDNTEVEPEGLRPVTDSIVDEVCMQDDPMDFTVLLPPTCEPHFQTQTSSPSLRAPSPHHATGHRAVRQNTVKSETVEPWPSMSHDASDLDQYILPQINLKLEGFNPLDESIGTTADNLHPSPELPEQPTATDQNASPPASLAVRYIIIPNSSNLVPFGQTPNLNSTSNINQTNNLVKPPIVPVPAAPRSPLRIQGLGPQQTSSSNTAAIGQSGIVYNQATSSPSTLSEKNRIKLRLKTLPTTAGVKSSYLKVQDFKPSSPAILSTSSPQSVCSGVRRKVTVIPSASTAKPASSVAKRKVLTSTPVSPINRVSSVTHVSIGLDPAEQQKLIADAEKQRRNRLANNEASKKCRRNKKLKEEAREQECQELEATNICLKAREAEYEKKIEKMKKLKQYLLAGQLWPLKQTCHRF